MKNTLLHMGSQPDNTEGPRLFPNTRWSVVLAAQRSTPESVAALEQICNSYWYPLYAYVRRCGLAPHDAQDVTQAFFYRFLEKRVLNSVGREKGKLRSFLVASLKNYMNNEWRRSATLRRGGGQTPVQFDTTFAESRLATDTRSLNPDETYDHEWAFTLLDLTVERLQAEFVNAGKPDEFDVLKECLMATRGEIDYSATAQKLGVNEGAARVVVHRLRKRFRTIYREEISQTLGEGSDVEAELRHLASALAR
jgi:RNA polymerase sigma-70 factor (ECF subfamily)